MSTTRKVIIVAVAAVAVFALGRMSAGPRVEDPHAGHVSEGVEASEQSSAEPTLWTCPMHPEIRLPEEGDCPKCGMDLVPMAKGDKTGPRQLAMSPASVALANIQTEPVGRGFLTRSVRMVGKVDYDETRVRTIAARVPGRLDHLYVDYTGVPVEQGDHLIWLYSPELLTAQQELLEAKKRIEGTSGEESEFLRKSNLQGYEAARDKLLLWGLTESQVDEVEARGTADDHMLIRSPASGVVVHKALNEGDYVKEGTPIYRIADLSHLWVMLDAYEQDLPWIRYGQSVAVTTEAQPGKVYEGWISFVDPTVDERTRTVQVRVNVDNEAGDLKPGMFARAVVEARVGAEGQVLEPWLRGMWISPMHPEIVKDVPGQCDVCGMDLVPAESLLPDSGSVASGRPLVVPTSAVLVTGKRAVVYVEVPGAERPTFEGREVVLGPRADEHYIVLEGLTEGESVVTNGAFKLDSSMQIQAKPSMMSMPGETLVVEGPEASAFRESLRPLRESYIRMRDALAADSADEARKAAQELGERLAAVSADALSGDARRLWNEEQGVMSAAVRSINEAADIETLRRAFSDLSRASLELERAFGHAGQGRRYEVYCPMAFDGAGAAWLQSEERIRNPYFGASMLACGEVRAEFPGDEPSEMEAASPEVEVERVAPEPSAHVHGLEPTLEAYLDLQEALAADDFASSADHVQALQEVASTVAAHGGGADVETAVSQLKEAAAAIEVADIEAVRRGFELVTAPLVVLVGAGGNVSDVTLYRMHCPMAFDDRGAGWLQRGSELANPYFGAMMLRCGTTEEELPSIGGGR